MAPEVFKGSYNEKCDIWSCGVMLYALLSGHFPFKGNTKKEMMFNILSGSYGLGGPEWDRVSPSAKAFLKHLLCYDPKKRYSAGQALKDPWIVKLTAESAAETEKLAAEALANLKSFRVSSSIARLKHAIYPLYFAILG